jgi:glycosyltransferase involved in cell wall biosynthesis
MAQGTSTALVHDYLLVMRGAERTFAAIASCWPEAPIHTLLYDREGVEHAFDGRDVRTSYLQRFGFGQAGFRQLLPLFPRAAEHLPVDGYGCVVSSSSAFAHGVRPGPRATHVCYCHSPFRYAWHERDRALQEMPAAMRPVLRTVLTRTVDWDLSASTRVTHYIANSELTRERIGEFYGREASVVHPPVEVERFRLDAPEDYFLVVTEVVWHKRVEIALQAARRARVPIKVVGGGPDLKRLTGAYGSTAQFLGRVSDEDLVDLYSRARAVVVPSVEEFGIVAVEAQAAGRPVLAADAGGARETVVSGETGVLVPPDDVDAFAEAMRHTDFHGFSPERLSEHAGQFSTELFRKRFVAEVTRLTGVPVPAAAAVSA